MSKQRAKDMAFGPDDYNQPTEPVGQIILPPYASPTYTAEHPYNRGSAAPWADAPAYPQGAPPAYPLYQSPVSPVYPVQPQPYPANYGGRPAGSMPPVYQPGYRRRARGRWFPGLVGVFFVLVQLALLARVVCMILSVPANSVWLSLLYRACDLFVSPVSWLAANINVSVLAGTQLLIYLEFLFAILAYGILSRILVRILKIFFNSW